MRVLAVTNIYPSPKFPASGVFVEQRIRGLRNLGVEVGLLHISRDRKGIFVYLKMASLLNFSLKEFQPDIVHVMCGGVMAEITTRLVRDTPVVVTFCGTDLLGGSFFSFPKRLMVNYGVFASILAAKRADGIIVVSRILREVLEKKNINLNKTWIIPSPVDINKFKELDAVECRRQLGWDDNIFHVLFPASTAHPIKRFSLASSAIARLRSCGIPVQLHQLKGVPHEEVPVWLNASNVLLVTSFHEGSPNVVKEALACNRAVVSVNVGDVRERLQDIEGCYLASPQASDLAEKLKLVFHGPQRIQGRIKIQELSLENIARRIKEVYIALLK